MGFEPWNSVWCFSEDTALPVRVANSDATILIEEWYLYLVVSCSHVGVFRTNS